MDVSEDSRARKPRRARGGDNPPAPPRPQVPRRARIWLSVGTFAGLFCAEAMSSMRLYSLGEHAGYPPFLAWLLPGALDIYALTLVWFFSFLPAEHPLRRKAAREAALALGITVLCNALDEIVETFAAQLPFWAPRVLFVLISALAPFVAYRLIHFRAEIGNDVGAVVKETTVANRQREAVNDAPGRRLAQQPPTGNETDETVSPIDNPADNDNPTPRQPVDGNPVNNKPRERQRTAVKQAAAGQPSTDTWVEIGKPLYDNLRAELGKRPGEGKFCAALTERVTELIGRGELPEVYAAPSLSTAKRIRGEIEDRFPGIMFGHHAEEASDVAEEVA